ncbi:hypothetical protein U1Q18_012956 [Sarracenia purpurea var. burkii]
MGDAACRDRRHRGVVGHDVQGRCRALGAQWSVGDVVVDDGVTWYVGVSAGDGMVVRDERWNQWTRMMMVDSFNGGLMATKVLVFAIQMAMFT